MNKSAIRRNAPISKATMRCAAERRYLGVSGVVYAVRAIWGQSSLIFAIAIIAGSVQSLRASLKRFSTKQRPLNDELREFTSDC